MNYPNELNYTKDHEWIKEEDGKTVIGISDFAQEQLGGLVFINLPEVGDEISVGEVFCDVESVKAVSDIYSPVTGVIVEVNEDLADNPELMNDTPYDAWIIKVEQVSETDELMNAQEYEAFTKEEA